MKKEFLRTILLFLFATNLCACMGNSNQSGSLTSVKTAFDQKVEAILNQMTLEEKASLCSGRDNWTTKPVERLELPAVWVSDGPHGVRRAPTSDVGGFGDQLPATCYPTASALAATWDVELIYNLGQALGVECQSQNVNVLLGPGANIKRSPCGGRNFEYFSEDPVLAGEMATAYINGVQSQGVGTSLKHYVTNNQEYKRMLMSSEVDQRTMREIYLPAFERAVKQAQPWTIMACYNRVNGEYGTQHKELLTGILKNEWGFDGIVISDWKAVVDRVKGIKAGLHIEMPGSEGVNDKLIVEAVKNGSLKEEVLDNLVKEILRFVLKAKMQEKENIRFDVEKHHLLARHIAAEATTLLKNDQQLLPITREKYKNIAVIGEFAKKPRFQGNGSSEVKPTKVDVAYEEILKVAGSDYRLTYSQGYSLTEDENFSMIDQAKKDAAKADVAVVFVGLPQHYESEGYDRTHIDIPPSHNKLVKEIAEVQKNVVVVLVNGSALTIPWKEEVNTIVEAWLSGQAGGGAIADVLFGKVNPSGKIAETFAKKLEDTPAYLNFPGENRKVIFGEGIFTGYRWFEKRKIEPLFPFGHGLSYTTFEYSDLRISDSKINDTDSLTVSVRIKNSGGVAGKEVVQLYVKDKQSTLERPEKELKAFKKVNLEPGQEELVSFKLGFRDFAFFDALIDQWVVETGEFEVLIGSSSVDIREQAQLMLKGTKKYPLNVDEYTFLSELLNIPETKTLLHKHFSAYFKSQLKPGQTFDDLQIEDFILEMPLVKFTYISEGLISKEQISQLIDEANKITLTR